MPAGTHAPRPYLPWREQLLAVLLAALCSIAFLRDGLLPGRALLPYPPERIEPLRSEALADGRVSEADLRAGNLGMGDKLGQSVAWDRITADRLRAGSMPLWTRDIAGGAAFVPQMGQVYQPWNLLLLAVPSTEVYGLWYLLHQMAFGWLAYRFLRRVGVSHAGAAVGVVCVVLGLWTQARLHHNVMLTAALPFFGLLSCVHELFVRRGGARAAGLLALGTGLSWLGGMPYLSLLASTTTAAFALGLLVRAPRGARLRPALWTAAGLAAGGLLGLAQMGPVLLAAAHSARAAPSLDALAAHALDALQALTAFWPDAFSWPADVFHPAAGDQPRMAFTAATLLQMRPGAAVDSYVETAFSIGVPASALALAGLLHHARRTVLGWALLGAFAFSIAAGFRPTLWLASLLPGVTTGDVRRWLFLVGMALAVLAALGFDHLCKRGPRLLIATALGVALASLALLLLHAGDARDVQEMYAHLAQARLGVPPDTFHAAVIDGEAEANRARLIATFTHALIAATATLVLGLLWRHRTARAALLALAALDLIVWGRGTFVAVDSARLTTPPRILAPALAATRDAPGARPRFQRLGTVGDQRFAALLMPNLGAFWGLEDLAAYNPLPPRRMEELFAAIAGPGVATGGAGVTELRDPATLAQPMLDVLGIEWILAANAQALPGLEDRTPADSAGPFRLYRRTTCLPRATFLSRARCIEDPAQRLRALADPARDAAAELLLEDPAAPLPTAAGDASVAIVAHADERVQLRVRTAAAGYLRLADPWDSGWTVTVDGAPAPLWIADHYLRAVWLEAGDHDVVFAYDGPWVAWPCRLALLGLALALAMLAVPALARRRTA